MFLKTLLLVLGTHCLLSTADNELPPAAEIKEKCQEMYNISEDDLSTLNTTRYLATPDENIKCFVKCFLTELKLINEAGDITLEDAKSRNAAALKHLESCEHVTGATVCDKAVNFQNCVWKEMGPEEKLLDKISH